MTLEDLLASDAREPSLQDLAQPAPGERAEQRAKGSEKATKGSAMEISSELLGLILGLALPALVGLIVFGVVRQISAMRQARAHAELASGDDFRMLAEQATEFQKKTLQELRTTNVAVAELRERVAAMEKLLRDV